MKVELAELEAEHRKDVKDLKEGISDYMKAIKRLQACIQKAEKRSKK